MLLGLGSLGGIAWLLSGNTAVDTGSAAAVSSLIRSSFYLAAAVSVVGFAFVNPSVSSLVSKRADPTRQGEVLGVNQSFASLGRILGPFLGSVLFSLHGSRALPYMAAVGTLLVVTMLLPRIWQRP